MASDSNPLLDNFFGRDQQTGRKKNIVISTIPSVEERVVLTIEEDNVFMEAADQFAGLLNQAHIPFGIKEQKKFSIGMKLIIESSREYEEDIGIPRYDDVRSYLNETAAQILPYYGDTRPNSIRYNIPYYFKVYEPEMHIDYIRWQRGDGKMRQFFLFPVLNGDLNGLIFGATGGKIEIFDPQDEAGIVHIENYHETDESILEEFRQKIIAQSIMSREEMEFFIS